MFFIWDVQTLDVAHLRVLADKYLPSIHHVVHQMDVKDMPFAFVVVLKEPYFLITGYASPLLSAKFHTASTNKNFLS